MFSWDTKKAISNFDKHNVSFEEGATCFVDEFGLDWEDYEHSSTIEHRRKRLAQSTTGKVLLVIYTLRRLDNGKETIRIISARQASRKERQIYARL